MISFAPAELNMRITKQTQRCHRTVQITYYRKTLQVKVFDLDHTCMCRLNCNFSLKQLFGRSVRFQTIARAVIKPTTFVHF